MENQRWLLVLICAAAFIGGLATALSVLDGADLVKVSQGSALTATKSDSGTSDADLGIEHYYYLKH